MNCCMWAQQTALSATHQALKTPEPVIKGSTHRQEPERPDPRQTQPSKPCSMPASVNTLKMQFAEASRNHHRSHTLYTHGARSQHTHHPPHHHIMQSPMHAAKLEPRLFLVLHASKNAGSKQRTASKPHGWHASITLGAMLALLM
jgi:hypothetical protein